MRRPPRFPRGPFGLPRPDVPPSPPSPEEVAPIFLSLCLFLSPWCSAQGSLWIHKAFLTFSTKGQRSKAKPHGNYIGGGGGPRASLLIPQVPLLSSPHSLRRSPLSCARVPQAFPEMHKCYRSWRNHDVQRNMFFTMTCTNS
jgi:hypothetical protein